MKAFTRISACIILLFISILDSSYARWLAISDAPTKNSYIKTFTIDDDGTYEIIGELRRKILTEIGRGGASNVIIRYNGDNEKIEIIEAKTIRNGKEYKLNKELIEDKPLASSHNGFDQMRQIFIGFPKAEINSTLYVKYKFILKNSNLENFFSETFYFGRDELEVKSHIVINSKLPLHALVNDPKHLLKITKTSSKNIHRLDIVLDGPAYDSAIDEPEPTIINHKYFTWVSVSSLNNWLEFAAKHGDQWGKIFTQKLPKRFERILEVAKKKNTSIEKINTVTSLLADKIRYMGDWRSVKGHLIPRSLSETSRSQFGDCKDFSAATAAILVRLGFKAQIALVMRGVDRLSKHILPSFEAFNHAIVKVTDKNGKVYWIDPTNFESMAGGIFPDIADKMTLVLDPKYPKYEKIPKVDYRKAGGDLKREWDVLSDGKITEKGELILRNETTLGLIGSALRVSDDVIKSAVFNSLTNRYLDEKNKKYMRLPKLSSRIVEDISLSYSFEQENQVWLTNIGPALRLTYAEPISKICNVSQDYISNVLIDKFPNIRKRQTIIKNVTVQNIESLNKEMKTPWVYIKRKCSINNKGNLQIDDDIITYKNLIPPEDFKKPEFLRLKDWLEKNFKNVIIVIKPTT